MVWTLYVSGNRRGYDVVTDNLKGIRFEGVFGT